MDLFKNQKYSKLRKHHQDLGVPWTDPCFPPSDSSIGHSKMKDLPRNILWKRPQEICNNPRLFVDGISSKDSTQGRLGNCWFVAACSVLAGSKTTWEKVIPDPEDQEWDDAATEKYSGIFRFRFWRFGKWVEVLVDDFLPVTADNQLLFTHSSSNKEFWTALLEKAYAKLHGCYAVLDGGNLSDALVDFTSGVSEVMDLEKERPVLRSDLEKRKNLFRTMEAEIDDHALMCCAIKATTAEEMEQRTDLGLVKGHAYGITAVRRVPIGGTNLKTLFKGREKLWLVRLQNPWGRCEWKCPMSDSQYTSPPPYCEKSVGNGISNFLYSSGSLSRMLSRSPEWSNITEKEREKLGLTFRDDGEFWMPFDDFLANFTEMSICRLINTSLFSFSKTWTETHFFGTWEIGTGHLDRAGGCANNPETFLNNPQFRFDLVKSVEESNKDDDKDSEPEKGPEVIIQLSQRDTRVMLDEPKENLVIGFQILRCEVNRKYRLHSVIPDSVVATSDYIRTKHIFLRVFPKYAGRYLIIPTTFKPGESTDFLLRIFTENSTVKNILHLEKDFPSLAWYQKCCCIKPVHAVTRIKVKGASGLEKLDAFGTTDPYCFVRCLSKKIKGPVAQNTLAPTWKDFSVVFYRKNLNNQIKLEIWNHNLVVDTFMGRAIITAPLPDADGVVVKETQELSGKGRQKGVTMPGKITFEYETTTDLTKL